MMENHNRDLNLKIPGFEAIDWSLLYSLGLQFGPEQLLTPDGELDETKVEEFLDVIDSLLNQLDEADEGLEELENQMENEIELFSAERDQVRSLFDEIESVLPESQVKQSNEIEPVVAREQLIDKI